MKIKLPKIKVQWKQWRYKRNREYRQHINQWHSKFAWIPLEIITKEKEPGYKTVVWFEWVMQQGFGNGERRKTIWKRYPEKIFFKKKLAGEIPEEDPNVWSGMESADNSSASSSNLKIQNPNIKGGPQIGPNYKKDITIHRSDDKIIAISVKQTKLK